jgi:hypothetical protein
MRPRTAETEGISVARFRGQWHRETGDYAVNVATLLNEAP